MSHFRWLKSSSGPLDDRLVPYPSDLNDEQWVVLEPLLRRAGKRGPAFGADLQMVVDAMLYVSHTG